MLRISLIIFCLFSVSLYSQEVKKIEKSSELEEAQEATKDEVKDFLYKRRISPQFYQGPYLIYHCRGKFFSCIGEDGFARCDEKRKEAIEKKKTNKACVPFKKFKTIEKCLETLEEKMGNIVSSEFCQ